MSKKTIIPGETLDSQPNDNPDSKGAFEQLTVMLDNLKAPPSQTNQGPPALQPVTDNYSGSLDDAASLLLRQLDPSVRDYAFELADLTLKIPRWQLLLGAVLSQFESGNLQAPSIPPGWSKIEVVSGTSICEWCKKPFTPVRYGQKFCVDLCGNMKRKAEIAAINAQKERELKLRKATEHAAIEGTSVEATT